MHQDVFILNRNFLADLLAVFEDDPEIGMIGMVGYEKMSGDGSSKKTGLSVQMIKQNFLFSTGYPFLAPAAGNPIVGRIRGGGRAVFKRGRDLSP